MCSGRVNSSTSGIRLVNLVTNMLISFQTLTHAQRLHCSTLKPFVVFLTITSGSRDIAETWRYQVSKRQTMVHKHTEEHESQYDPMENTLRNTNPNMTLWRTHWGTRIPIWPHGKHIEEHESQYDHMENTCVHNSLSNSISISAPYRFTNGEYPLLVIHHQYSVKRRGRLLGLWLT